MTIRLTGPRAMFDPRAMFAGAMHAEASLRAAAKLDYVTTVNESVASIKAMLSACPVPAALKKALDGVVWKEDRYVTCPFCYGDSEGNSAGLTLTDCDTLSIFGRRDGDPVLCPHCKSYGVWSVPKNPMNEPEVVAWTRGPGVAPEGDSNAD